MDEKVLSTAVLKFSLRFLDELDNTRSVVSSPLSAETLLALLALGDTEQTHEELLTELGFPDDDAIRTSFAQLTERLKNIDGVTLDVANKIYMNKGSDLDPQIHKDAENVFNAGFEIMDFKNGAAVAAHANDWVEKKTHQKIQKIMTPDGVTEDQEMILLNAIYFKGNWADAFNKDRTSEQEFYVDANTTILVQMMRQESKFKCGMCTDLEAQILVLPYIGGASKMAIILPNSYESEALQTLLKKIASGYDILEAINNTGSTKTNVNLPKFKIETEINLTPVLKNLGLQSMFTTGFNKILKSKQPVHVSEAIQKAIIEVNEEGTEAAAVTKMTLMLRCMPPQFIADHPFVYILLGPGDIPLFVVVIMKMCLPPQFIADHPFLYILLGEGGIPLFVGVYRGEENAPKTEKRPPSGIEIYSAEDDKIATV